MKIKSLLLLLFFAAAGAGQTVNPYDCAHCGYYQGHVDKVSEGEINHIFVKLTLTSDSVYWCEVGGVFSWCNSLTFTSRGAWLCDEGWIYFKPEVYESSECFFALGTPLPKLSSPETYARRNRHRSEGYTEALQLTTSKTGCEQIRTRIALDCFKGCWYDHPLQKFDCK